MSNDDADTAAKSHDDADCAAKSTIAHNGNADTAAKSLDDADCAARPVNVDSSNRSAAKSNDDADRFDDDAANDTAGKTKSLDRSADMAASSIDDADHAADDESETKGNVDTAAMSKDDADRAANAAGMDCVDTDTAAKSHDDADRAVDVTGVVGGAVGVVDGDADMAAMSNDDADHAAEPCTENKDDADMAAESCDNADHAANVTGIIGRAMSNAGGAIDNVGVLLGNAGGVMSDVTGDADMAAMSNDDADHAAEPSAEDKEDADMAAKSCIDADHAATFTCDIGDTNAVCEDDKMDIDTEYLDSMPFNDGSEDYKEYQKYQSEMDSMLLQCVSNVPKEEVDNNRNTWEEVLQKASEVSKNPGMSLDHVPKSTIFPFSKQEEIPSIKGTRPSKVNDVNDPLLSNKSQNSSAFDFGITLSNSEDNSPLPSPSGLFKSKQNQNTSKEVKKKSTSKEVIDIEAQVTKHDNGQSIDNPVELGSDNEESKPFSFVTPYIEIEGISSDFAKEYLTIVNVNRHFVPHVEISNTAVQNIENKYQHLLKQHDPDTFVTNRFLNDKIRLSSLGRIIEDFEWVDGEGIIFVFNLFNIRSHLYAINNDTVPDFFMTTSFSFGLFGEKLNEYRPDFIEGMETRPPLNKFFGTYRKVFIPVNEKITHWSLIVVDFFAKTIHYFDSTSSTRVRFKKRNHHPIVKMFNYMKELAKRQKYDFCDSEWTLYFDDENVADDRIRDPNIKYAYQVNGSDCGLYTLLTAEVLYFTSSHFKDGEKLKLDEYLSPVRMTMNHYRKILAALIMTFRMKDFEVLFPKEYSFRTYTVGKAIMEAPKEEIYKICRSAYSSFSKTPGTYDITILLDLHNNNEVISQDRFASLDVHNKLVSLLSVRDEFANILEYRFVREDTAYLRSVKKMCADISLKSLSQEVRCPRGKKLFSKEIKHSDLMMVQSAIVKNFVFDYGFRVYSSSQIYSRNRLCFCPFGSKGRQWRNIFDLKHIENDCFCGANKYFSPYGLIEHLDKKKNCLYHNFLGKYLRGVYGNFWKNEIKNPSQNVAHYGLFPERSSPYNTALSTFVDYGRESPMMYNLNKRPTPSVKYDTSCQPFGNEPGKKTLFQYEQDPSRLQTYESPSKIVLDGNQFYDGNDNNQDDDYGAHFDDNESTFQPFENQSSKSPKTQKVHSKKKSCSKNIQIPKKEKQTSKKRSPQPTSGKKSSSNETSLKKSSLTVNQKKQQSELVPTFKGQHKIHPSRAASHEKLTKQVSKDKVQKEKDTWQSRESVVSDTFRYTSTSAKILVQNKLPGMNTGVSIVNSKGNKHALTTNSTTSNKQGNEKKMKTSDNLEKYLKYLSDPTNLQYMDKFIEFVEMKKSQGDSGTISISNTQHISTDSKDITDVKLSNRQIVATKSANASTNVNVDNHQAVSSKSSSMSNINTTNEQLVSQMSGKRSNESCSEPAKQNEVAVGSKLKRKSTAAKKKRKVNTNAIMSKFNLEYLRDKRMSVCCDQEKSEEYDIVLKYISEVPEIKSLDNGDKLKFSCIFPHNPNLPFVDIMGLSTVKEIIQCNKNKQKYYMRLPIKDFYDNLNKKKIVHKKKAYSGNFNRNNSLSYLGHVIILMLFKLPMMIREVLFFHQIIFQS